MVQITKDTVIGDILDIAPETVPIFPSIDMHYPGCPSSRSETVKQAYMVHDVEVEELLVKINTSMAAAQQKTSEPKRGGPLVAPFLS